MQHHEHLTGSKDIKFRLSREDRFYYLNFVSNRSTEKNSITPMKKRFFVVNIIVVYIALFFLNK